MANFRQNRGVCAAETSGLIGDSWYTKHALSVVDTGTIREMILEELMMTIFTGKTIEAATAAGLATLNAPREQVTVTVVATPRKGWLGIGHRDAQVDVVLKAMTPAASSTPVSAANLASSAAPVKAAAEATAPSEPAAAEPSVSPAERRQQRQAAIEGVQDYLATIVDQLGIDATLDLESSAHRQIRLAFTTDKEGLLIGKHGRTINALQSLAQLYLNHHGAAHVEIELDVAGYRERRAATLSRLADNTAREVVASGKPIYLDPMPSFERKQIHAVLAKNQYVTTYSAGKEPHRAVVIQPV
ncbi:protein jag [Levilactobacillus brevis KB290]|nr:RNA-binding cell elongation regulator Jag/EloR [Levilactobacillus brevis]MCM6814343.1 protein jag [Levilactobacillus brevis]BAN08024.1 protein jag [Levilactobacillus brevis KB290]